MHSGWHSENDRINISAAKNENWESLVGQYVEQVMFDDGTVWDLTGGLNLENPNCSWMDGTVYNDTMTAVADCSSLHSRGSDDILIAAANNIYMTGGTGNDTYVVNNTSATITENAVEGTDTVQSNVVYELGNNIENLTLQ